jgi:hypothetical protein
MRIPPSHAARASGIYRVTGGLDRLTMTLLWQEHIGGIDREGRFGSTPDIKLGGGALLEAGPEQKILRPSRQDAESQPLMSAISASAHKAGPSAVSSRSTVRNSRPSRATPSNSPPPGRRTG